MAGNQQLLVTIGAALSSGFNSVISGSTSKIKQIGGAIKDLEKNSLVSAGSLEKLKTQYNSLLGSINKQQMILSKRANYRSQILGVAALSAALAAPAKAAMEFEDSLAQIKAVVNFKEPDGLKKLGSTLTDISKRVPKTANDLAAIAAIGGRFGVAEKDLAGFSEEVAKTTVAWRMDAKTGAESIGNLMKTYKVSVGELPKYFDVINHLGNTTGATADEILSSVVRASAGISNFKLSVPQVAALASTLKSLDKSGGDAGQTVNQMIVRLASIPKLGKAGQEAFHKMGLGVHGFTELMMQDPQKAIDTLFDALSKLEGKDRLSALDAIFGKRAAQQVGNLIDKLDLYRHNLNFVANPEIYKGSRDVDYKIVLDETQSKLDLLKNSFSALVIEIGTALLPVVQSLADSISRILNPMQEWMKENHELVGQITTVVAELIGFKIAAFALGYAWTYVAGAWNTAVIGLKYLRLGLTMTGTAFKAFMGWPAIIAAALIGVGYLIWDNWEAIRDFFAGLWEPVKPYWNEFVSFIGKLAVTQFIIEGWNTVKNFFTGLWDSVSPYLSGFTDFISGLTVTQWIIEAWEKVRDFFSSFWSGIVEIWNDSIEQISEIGWIQSIIGAIDELKKSFSSFFSWLSEGWNKFTSPISNLWEGAKNMMPDIGGLFSKKEAPSKLKLPEVKPAMIAAGERTQNNNFTINVKVDKKDDANTLSNKIVNAVSAHERTYLYDTVPEVI
ncbi:MAG: phage tail tape measure protein [Alphaproteobacteria bacterium]|nr:phage tail tape measure protein [Alphaproteobacteria bacterium]